MKETLIRDALDWSTQKSEFETDETLRDIYVRDTTVDDWRIVLRRILDGAYHAGLERAGVAVPLPENIESLFEEDHRHLLQVSINRVALSCHFFTPTEIEFSFSPEGITEAALKDLLAFMIDIGDAAKKPVMMTPENCPESPIFTYEPNQNQLRWMSP